MDPKDAPNFNPATARDADPATMDRLEMVARNERESRRVNNDHRAILRHVVREAKASGHSYSQIMDATGLSLGAVQRMVK